MMLTLLLVALVVVVTAENHTSPVVETPTEEQHQKLLRSEVEFAAHLLQTVAKENSSANVFLSPFSVYNALLLTYFSTSGSTEQTLRKTLHMPEDQQTYCKGLVIGDYFLLASKLNSQQAASKEYALSYANRIYVSDKLNMTSFMETTFPEELKQANFTGDAAGAVKQINSWVSEQTKAMIPKLLNNHDVTSQTTIVLVNAIYFNATWKSKFPNITSKENFHLANASTVPVMMMHQTDAFRMSNDSQLDATILELPYEGDDVSMLLLLPNKPSVSAIPDLLNKITEDTLLSAYKKLSAAKPDDVIVSIPKFEVERSYDLKPILSSMGAGALFNSSSDFSPLIENAGGISISAAIHKTKIRVTEQGTEAAGATGVINAGLSPGGPPTPEFNADHPFLYAIYDKPSSLFLFTGIFNSP